MAVATNQLISALYVAFFQRGPDQNGLNFWLEDAQKSNLQDQFLARKIADGFTKHPSFTSIYGSLGNSAFINEIYLNIGGAKADTAGKDFWLNEIENKQMSRSDFVGDFVFLLLNITVAELQQQRNSGSISQVEYDNAILRQDRLTNKSLVGLTFTQKLGAASNLSPNTLPNDPASLEKDDAYRASQIIIRDVTEDDATLVTPINYLNGTPTIPEILGFGNNTPPVITSNNGGDTATINFNENSSPLQLTTVTATDTSGEVLRYALTGTNADLFNLDPITGVLSFKARPNVTADTNYAVTVTVTDSARNTDSQTLTIAVKNEVQSDQAPTITSNGGGDAASINYQKTSTAAVTTVTATDPTPNDQLTYSIEGGANAALFQIDAGTGTLTFKTPPSALTQDTSYVVVVKVADQFGGTDTQTLTINVQVQPSNVPPVITSNGGGGAASISFVENGTGPVTTVTATDADVSDTGKLVYSLATSTDIDFFTIDASTGVLSFKKAPDFESATHAPEYAVAVKVTDLAGNSDTQLLTITVTDQPNETITGGTGNDSLPGGTGNDVINGGTGNETINGGAGNDAIDGGAGDDSIDGGLGNDTVVGGDGNDTVLGGDGDDGINGGAGDDSIDGGLGNDIVIGGDGNDTVLGGDGDDVVGGLGGNDVLNGGPGADSLVGGAGNDTITGGTGVDTFFFESTGTFNGVDQILDFQGGAGGDVMNFTAFLGTATVKYDAPLLTVTSGGGGLLGDLLGILTTTLTDADAAPQDDMDAALSQGGVLSTVGRGVTGLLGNITGSLLNTTVNDLISGLTATNFANGTIATLKVLATETTDGSTVTEGFIGTQFGGTTGVFAVPEVGEKYVLLASVEADATNAAALPNGAPVHIFYVEYDAAAANSTRVTLVGTANLGAGNDVDNFVAANFA